jgi:hypothetical protein
MSERTQREFADMLDTLDRSDRARLSSANPDGLGFTIGFCVESLYRGPRGTVEQRGGEVQVIFQMHPDHPLVPPFAVAKTPDLYNSHIANPARAPRNMPPLPFVCLGPFSPQMRIGDWVVATYDVLRWSRISTTSPLDEEAAAFARRESAKPGRFPVDTRPFWREGVATQPAAPEPSRATAAHASPVVSAGLRLGEWRSQ